MTIRLQTSRFGLIGLVLDAVAACDGFGSPIVGEKVRVGNSADCRSIELPACRPIEPPPAAIVSMMLEPFDSPDCPDRGPLRRTTVSAPGEPLPSELICDDLEVRLVPGPASLTMSALSARSSLIKFVAELPTTVTIAASHLSTVRIELHGPVSLRILEASTLDQVRIDTPPAHGASIELSEVNASHLAVESLAGRVAIARSRLGPAQLVVRQLSIDTTAFEELSVRSDELFAARIEGRHLALELGRSQLSASSIEGLSLRRCSSMFVVSSTISDGVLSPCTDAPLRIDGSTIMSTQALGAIESSFTEWFGNELGGGSEATSLAIWESANFNANVLCGNLARVALIDTHAIACNVCELLRSDAPRVVCGLNAKGGPSGPTLGGVDYGVFNPRCLPLDLPAACNPPPVDPLPL
jgi:hypothetical protein